MSTLFVNALTVIDAAQLHPQRGLLGESWLVDIELDGTLDHQGMVLDFGKVKRQVKRLIDERFDHRLLVPAGYSGLSISRQEHRIDLVFHTMDGQVFTHSSPWDAVALIDCPQIDEQTLAHAIIAEAATIMPDNVEAIRIRLRQETIDGAHYHYTHGLKHHTGNCQRIAHGHRSRICIERNGQAAEELERSWAKRWRDRYIGTRSDLISRDTIDGVEYYRFGYTAQQGRFELQLPQAYCYLIDTDSTVENLAQHITDALKQQEPEAAFTVHAFEGVEKGAIGRS